MPKISQLPDASSLDSDDDVVPVVVGGVTQKATVGQVRGEDVTEEFHSSAITPSTFRSPDAVSPAVEEDGPLVTLAFTVGVDAAFRQFKIPTSFVSGATAHIHWTKSGNADESGKRVKWQLTYSVFDGESEDAVALEQVVDVEDTYEDSGTTTRVVHRTADVALTSFAAGKYVAMKIEAIAPSQDPLVSEPALFSADFIWNQKVFG